MRSPVPLRPRRGPAALVAALLIGLLGAAAPTATAAPPPGAVPVAVQGAVPAAVPGAVPAAGKQQQTFGIQPASATAPDSRSAYTYIGTPGAQVKDHVAVWNYGDQPLSLTLYAADAFNTDTGGYDVLPAGKPSTDVGAWVHLATATVTLPPRSRQIVPFTLAIPADAGPGDHSGGIVLALRRQTVDAKGNAVAVDQRVGARIHLRVPGALRPALTIESVRTTYRGTLNPISDGSATTSYTVRNTGNIRLGGRQAVRVRNALGNVVTAKGPAALTELLPGNSATYTVTVGGVFPALWQTASITIDPLALPGDIDPALPSATRSVQYPTIPWTLLAILLVLLLAGGARFRRARRRRRGAAGGGGGGATPGRPVPPTPAPAPAVAVAPTGSGGNGDGATGVPVPVPVAVPVPMPVPVPVPAPGGVTAPVPVPVSGAVPEPVSVLVADAAAVPVAVPVPVPVPGGATVPGPTPVPGPVPASEPATAAATPTVELRKAGTAALAMLLLGGLALGGLAATAPRAYADPTTRPAPGASRGTGAAGTLAFDYATGHLNDAVDVLTSGPCPHADDSLMASFSGEGFPAGGATVVGLSPASIYPVAANGGYVVPLGNTPATIAQQNGVTRLHGRYTVDVYCKGRFLAAHYRDFRGTLTFAADGTWKAAGTPATVLIHGNSATPAPVPPAAPSLNAPNQTAAASASSGGIPSDSIAALFGGGGLLALLGVSYLRRQRARVKEIRSSAGSANGTVGALDKEAVKR
ncbi:hypothetical protein ACEZDB_09525 [Streptacidiphilus sp. N1-3]|uniref:DUF916 domain-containing protein n=1 Tax=Streptacidiphilus alkalitolerans TaxID=3342712 RepID=A0ABV6WYT7_9ACTN